MVRTYGLLRTPVQPRSYSPEGLFAIDDLACIGLGDTGLDVAADLIDHFVAHALPCFEQRNRLADDVTWRLEAAAGDAILDEGVLIGRDGDSEAVVESVLVR